MSDTSSASWIPSLASFVLARARSARIEFSDVIDKSTPYLSPSLLRTLRRLQQRADRCIKTFGDPAELNRADCSCAAHDFAHRFLTSVLLYHTWQIFKKLQDNSIPVAMEMQLYFCSETQCK